VRAARICSAGHGGQILLSETTRALLGNDLPEGVSVVDLGRQSLKDIQHERIYELALDSAPGSFPPLKTEAPKSSSDLLAERIERHVEEMVVQSLTSKGKGPTSTLSSTIVGLVELLLVVAAIIAIVLLIKLTF
jgi:hypothetical protein